MVSIYKSVFDWLILIAVEVLQNRALECHDIIDIFPGNFVQNSQSVCNNSGTRKRRRKHMIGQGTILHCILRDCGGTLSIFAALVKICRPELGPEIEKQLGHSYGANVSKTLINFRYL